VTGSAPSLDDEAETGADVLAVSGLVSVAETAGDRTDVSGDLTGLAADIDGLKDIWKKVVLRLSPGATERKRAKTSTAPEAVRAQETSPGPGTAISIA
jgi:hypothetical protein